MKIERFLKILRPESLVCRNVMACLAPYSESKKWSCYGLPVVWFEGIKSNSVNTEFMFLRIAGRMLIGLSFSRFSRCTGLILTVGKGNRFFFKLLFMVLFSLLLKSIK